MGKVVTMTGNKLPMESMIDFLKSRDERIQAAITVVFMPDGRTQLWRANMNTETLASACLAVQTEALRAWDQETEFLPVQEPKKDDPE